MFISQFVFVDDLLRNVAAMNAHVLVGVHVGGQEKIFQITSAVSRPMFGIGDDAVEVKFGVDNANGRGPNILESIEAITTNGHSNATGVGFPGTHGADKVDIGDFSAWRDLIGFDEKDGAAANDGSDGGAMLGEALGAATPFIGE